MKKFCIFAIFIGITSLSNLVNAALIVDFAGESSKSGCVAEISSGTLTFVEKGFNVLCVEDPDSPNSNGSNGLVFAGYDLGSYMTITRTDGANFELLSLDMSISWYDSNL